MESIGYKKKEKNGTELLVDLFKIPDIHSQYYKAMRDSLKTIWDLTVKSCDQCFMLSKPKKIVSFDGS